MIAGTIAKVTCRYCDFKVFPGNRPRHEQACLRRNATSCVNCGDRLPTKRVDGLCTFCRSVKRVGAR